MEYERAVSDCEALVKRLGAGWRIEVWENLGWHYSAKKGVATVRGRLGHGYMLYFNTARQVICSGDTPKEAVSLGVKKAYGIATEIMTDCEELMK